MQRLIKFFRLTAERRALLIAAAGLLVAIRIALALMPLRQLRDLLAWRPRQRSETRAGPAPTLQEIIWATERAAAFVPGATCLVQALAALRLCQSAGFAAAVKIGTAKAGDGTLQGHAWLEYRGEIMLGAVEDKIYAPLLIWTAGGWRSAAAERP